MYGCLSSVLFKFYWFCILTNHLEDGVNRNVKRDSLIENIYPKLKDYCREKYGLECQV
jgi:hypothetical protein